MRKSLLFAFILAACISLSAAPAKGLLNGLIMDILSESGEFINPNVQFENDGFILTGDFRIQVDPVTVSVPVLISGDLGVSEDGCMELCFTEFRQAGILMNREMTIALVKKINTMINENGSHDMFTLSSIYVESEEYKGVLRLGLSISTGKLIVEDDLDLPFTEEYADYLKSVYISSTAIQQDRISEILMDISEGMLLCMEERPFRLREVEEDARLFVPVIHVSLSDRDGKELCKKKITIKGIFEKEEASRVGEENRPFIEECVLRWYAAENSLKEADLRAVSHLELLPVQSML